jgi:hypothetical protein
MGFGILGKHQIAEKWGAMIGDAAGRGEDLLSATEHFLELSQAPDTKLQRRSMSPGVLRGALGGKRPFVVISNTSNTNLRPFKLYLNVRDYGTNLQVSWYLVSQPNFKEKLSSFILSIPVVGLLFAPSFLFGRASNAGKAGMLELDIFDEQDLSAYVTNLHHCVLDAVDNLMQELNQDFSRIDRQSKGFLGIS